MKILAIDTSCDETSVAILENDWILSNKLSSQIQAHNEWGGVVPSLAKRKHEELIDLVISQALKQAKVRLEDIDVFAATKGPGLSIALEVGLAKIKEFANLYKKPMIAVNHMEGHIYSTLAKNSKGLPHADYQFPLLVLLISGGHTELVLMKDHGKYEIIGQTLDDALGEAFDKVGRMLDLGYPAGPAMEKIAENGDENAYRLPIPMKHSNDANMSYSGLKTASMKLINEELSESNKYLEKFRDNLSPFEKKKMLIERDPSFVPDPSSIVQYKQDSQVKVARQIVCNIAASFQKAAVEQVLLKTEFTLNKLSEMYIIKDLIIGGGVAQNKYLRKTFKKALGKKVSIHYPQSKKLYTDNAGMIGNAAYFNALRGNFVDNIDDVRRDPNWTLDEMG